MSRLTASMPVHADTYSTSSSTLVNNDTDDGAGKRMQRKPLVMAEQPSRLPIRRSRLTLLQRDERQEIQAREQRRRSSTDTHDSSPMAEPTASSPVRLHNRPRRSRKPRIQFPDDHRCSEYETDGGPCPCVLDAESSDVSSGSGSSVPSTSAVRLEDTVPSRTAPLVNGIAGAVMHDADGDDEAEYIRRIRSVRRKKMLQESSVLATPQAPGSFPKRQFHPFGARNDSSMVAHTRDEVYRNTSSDLRHTQSSPPRRSNTSVEDIGSGGYGSERSAPIASTPLRTQAARSSPAQSAASKSISNVFESLMREEKQRREDDRKRKEAARLRRREEKQRREGEMSLLSNNRGHVASDSVSTEIAEQRTPPRDAQSLLSGTPLMSPVEAMRGDAHPEDFQVQDASTLRNGKVEQPSARKQVSFASPPKAESRSQLASVKTPSPLAVHHSRSLISPFFPGRYKSPFAPRISEPVKEEANTAKLSTESSGSKVDSDEIKLETQLSSSGLPRESTPPLGSKEIEANALTGTEVEIGDDSIRLTVHDLMSALRQAKEVPQDLTSPSKSPSARSRFLEPGNTQALTLHSNGTTDEDALHQARLASVRTRLTQLAREIKLDEPVELVPLRDTSKRGLTWKSTMLLFGLQIALLYVMLMAAQAEAEHLFLTVHRDMWAAAAGRSALLPRTSVTTLFGSLLLKFGFLPDRFAISPQHRVVMSAIAGKSWSGVSRLAWSAVQQPHHRATAARLVIAKLVASLGIDEGDVVVLGHRVPT